MQGKTEEEIEMMKLMGFGSFDTTKVSTQSGHKVEQLLHLTLTTNLNQHLCSYA